MSFSDIPGNRIIKYTPGEGISDFRVPSGKSNRLTFDKKGRLVACEHENRRVSLTEKEGTVTTIASHFNGKKLNSPNEVVVKSDGRVYFTDPPYGLNPVFGSLESQELPFFGVYRLSPAGDELRLLVKVCRLCMSNERNIVLNLNRMRHITREGRDYMMGIQNVISFKENPFFLKFW